MSNKAKFKIKTDKFSDFINKLDELTKIEDTIKLKIDSENILMYSMMSSGQTMLAFKNYLINTTEYFEIPENMDYSIDIILPNSKKLVKNLNFLLGNDKLTFEITYKESPDDDSIMNARSIQFVGGKLKVNWIAGEHYEMRDINKVALKQRLDIKNRKWFFTIDKSEFSDIKKLSNINSDRIINISIVNGKVVLSEKSAWELEIDTLDDDRNANLMLNKKFLSCISESLDKVEFSIFETFMLIKDDISNLMLSYEQDFSDD